MKVPFNCPPYTGKELIHIKAAIENGKICGDGVFTKKSSEWLEEKFGAKKVLLTTSCTHALEMAAILCRIKPGDEVIMPSYTFSSTANAFVLRGAEIVFIDIRPDTMNMDETLIEPAITPKSKAIVPVHYAGVGCEMDMINQISSAHGLYVIEDAAQGVMSSYKGAPLGTIGDFGCFSFHETKNYSMGEGGALLIKDKRHIEDAEIIREKGTNRSRFWRGQIDKYTWIDMGSSFLPSEINAAYLWAQLEQADEINNARLSVYNRYMEGFRSLAENEKVELPYVPGHCRHNAHMFYIKTKNIEQRTKLIEHMKDKQILTVFHYIPLHSSPAGKRLGRFYGEDKYTTVESERLLRLPMYYGLTENDVDYVVEAIWDFYKSEK